MNKSSGLMLLLLALLSSCGNFNHILKSNDYDYKYEAAKEYYAAGKYSKSYQVLEDLVMVFKGSDKAEESLYMLAMCYFNLGDYETATAYFDRYTSTYSRGDYAELARFYSGKSSYLQSPDPRLDQSPTITAINSLQQFLDIYPYSDKREEVNQMIFALQDRLVQKEYGSAKLYYNLGSYTGNCTNGGSNYEACIITAENALKQYPYTNLREELYIMILRARYTLAQRSVEEKQQERFRQTVDEYFGFKNEFPDSKYIKEAENIYRHASARIKGEDID